MKNQCSNSCKNMPIIRIAPVCKGKIYVKPQASSCQMDLPMMEHVACHPTKSSNQIARQLFRKHTNINTQEEPRFSVRYVSPVNQNEHVYLYILPLGHEEEISFTDGKFISADEIELHAHLYSDYLQKESGLLGMAAELWEEYDSFKSSHGHQPSK